MICAFKNCTNVAIRTVWVSFVHRSSTGAQLVQGDMPVCESCNARVGQGMLDYDSLEQVEA